VRHTGQPVREESEHETRGEERLSTHPCQQFFPLRVRPHVLRPLSGEAGPSCRAGVVGVAVHEVLTSLGRQLRDPLLLLRPLCDAAVSWPTVFVVRTGDEAVGKRVSKQSSRAHVHARVMAWGEGVEILTRPTPVGRR
jgi:hypothetical protein